MPLIAGRSRAKPGGIGDRGAEPAAGGPAAAGLIRGVRTAARTAPAPAGRLNSERLAQAADAAPGPVRCGSCSAVADGDRVARGRDPQGRAAEVAHHRACAAATGIGRAAGPAAADDQVFDVESQIDFEAAVVDGVARGDRLGAARAVEGDGRLGVGGRGGERSGKREGGDGGEERVARRRAGREIVMAAASKSAGVSASVRPGRPGSAVSRRGCRCDDLNNPQIPRQKTARRPLAKRAPTRKTRGDRWRCRPLPQEKGSVHTHPSLGVAQITPPGGAKRITRGD